MSLSGLDLAAVGVATLVAGAVNALAGGGTLVSFPTLVAVGVPPLQSNVTNTVALCPGYLSGTWAQREDLAPQRRRVAVLSAVGALGGLVGSALLVVTPEADFKAAVPWLLLLSSALLLAQDRVRRFVRARTAAAHADATPGEPGGGQAAPGAADPLPGTAAGPPGAPVRAARPMARPVTPSAGVRPQARPVAPAAHRSPSPALLATVFAGSVYGGFFGAGLGIMLLALLGLWLDESMVRINAVKQALQFVVNVCAAAFFAASGHVRWEVVPVMAVAGVVGGAVGGRLTRVVNPTWLRRFVVAFGIAVAVDFWLTH